MTYSRSELKEIVREVLAELLGFETLPSVSKVVPTKEAISLLGYSSDEQLYDAISSGLLRLGKEVEDRRKPTAQRPRYFFHIERCRQRLSQLPEKRKV